MRELLEKIERLKRETVAKTIGQRMQEFQANGRNKDRIFSELCFCILTANNRADVGLKVQQELKGRWRVYNEPELAVFLKSMGSRFYRNKAKYLVGAREWEAEVVGWMQRKESGHALREWLVENVQGLGYKEASHFLRNVGYLNLAILDRHILRALERQGIAREPKTLTRRRYLRLEKKLGKVAKASGLTQAELDLYIWFIQTGRVLK